MHAAAHILGEVRGKRVSSMSLVELISQHALVTTTTPTLVHDGCEEERCRTEAGGVLIRASCGGSLHCYPTVADMFVKTIQRVW